MIETSSDLFHKCILGESDFNLSFVRSGAVHSHNTRHSNDLFVCWGKQTFAYRAAKDWNSLPIDFKGTQSAGAHAH